MIPNAFHIVFSGGGDTMFLSPWYLMVKSSCYPIFPEMIPYFMIIPSSRIPSPSSHIIPWCSGKPPRSRQFGSGEREVLINPGAVPLWLKPIGFWGPPFSETPILPINIHKASKSYFCFGNHLTLALWKGVFFRNFMNSNNFKFLQKTQWAKRHGRFSTFKSGGKDIGNLTLPSSTQPWQWTIHHF